jgi:hypothetical protein
MHGHLPGYERASPSRPNVPPYSLALSYFLKAREQLGLIGIGVATTFTAYFVTRMFFEMMSMFDPHEIALPAISAPRPRSAALRPGLWWNRTRPRTPVLIVLESRSYVGPGIIGLFALMWIGRAIHAAFQKGDKPRMPMMRLIGAPAINWVALRPIFFTFSLVISIAGLFMFFNIKKEDLYDIEFLGGPPRRRPQDARAR